MQHTPARHPLDLPRLIISDLDGTLLPESKDLTSLSRDVLGRIAEMGVVIGLATGKFLHLTRPYGEALGGDVPLIALDGARCGWTSGKVDHDSRGIPREVALEVLDRYAAAATNLFLDDGQDELLMRFEHDNFPFLIRHWASNRREVDDAREHVVDDSGIIALYGDEEEMRQISREAKATFSQLKVSYFTSTLMEGGRVVFQAGGVNKGTGVDGLCREMGIATRECMVFGDWYNDVALFQAGCVNVAMANAMPEVKALAHHITADDCESDGVARFLSRAFLDG